MFTSRAPSTNTLGCGVHATSARRGPPPPHALHTIRYRLRPHANLNLPVRDHELLKTAPLHQFLYRFVCNRSPASCSASRTSTIRRSN
ncbi:hypothetical protein PR202_gb01525 [Eleusine coracana subsp. coracana]|uniref:Uncharacterized protein n=1 Tax=Eleusine coracana subsp. coracana TaxID=191504 RepID=A0AAV5DWV9_ELECO|nr:hypothetical protein PR202_gb01525 [Eleusine coracana subsp. coracana]